MCRKTNITVGAGFPTHVRVHIVATACSTPRILTMPNGQSSPCKRPDAESNGYSLLSLFQRSTRVDPTGHAHGGAGCRRSIAIETHALPAKVLSHSLRLCRAARAQPSPPAVGHSAGMDKTS